MAKVSFTKLGLTKPQATTEIEWNEQKIEVKQYLPVNEKLELITNVINLSADDNNFANPVKVSVYTTLEMIDAYTNITFTEKQKEDPTKLYDLFIGNGLAKLIFEAIPEEEYWDLVSAVDESIKSVYKYKNSAMGIMEAISTDYSNLNFDATDIQEKLSNPENMGFLKDVLSKMG